jgi:tRNA C32,U32 (ribose-2'-O)-methylase TrmJ
LQKALEIVTNKVCKRPEFEANLQSEMQKIRRDYPLDDAKRVVKQFENSSTTNLIGMRTRTNWIKELRRRFKRKFSEHPEYNRLVDILDDLEDD